MPEGAEQPLPQLPDSPNFEGSVKSSYEKELVANGIPQSAVDASRDQVMAQFRQEQKGAGRPEALPQAVQAAVEKMEAADAELENAAFIAALKDDGIEISPEQLAALQATAKQYVEMAKRHFRPDLPTFGDAQRSIRDYQMRYNPLEQRN